MVAAVEIARSWIGTKFCHQGRRKDIGVDCIGLIAAVASGLGIEFADKNDYAREPNNGRLRAELEKYLTLCSLQVGVVALFEIEKEPQHVGIISDYGNGFGLIHAYAQARKVVEHNLDEFWRQRIVQVYGFKIKR